MSSKNQGIRIQKGFIAGVVAVCLVSISTGLVLKYGGISASPEAGKETAAQTASRIRCERVGVPQTEIAESDLTDSEIAIFGESAQGYDLKLNKKRAAVRFVIGAKNITSDDAGTTLISLGLTLKKGQVYKRWGTLMRVGFTDGSRQADVRYGTIAAGEPWTGSIIRTFSDTSAVSIYVHFSGRNYDGCVQGIKLSELLATSPSVDSSETMTITVKKGLNAFVLPWKEKVMGKKALADAGMRVFAFNRHGDQKWYTAGASVYPLRHRVGYYIYNPNVKKEVTLTPYANQSEPESSFYITTGWNLMAHSGMNNPIALKDIQYYLTSCPPNINGIASCQTAGTKVKLSDLFIGDEMTQKAYPVIFIVDDPYASDRDVAFKELKITAENRETAQIPAGKLFWVYIWP